MNGGRTGRAGDRVGQEGLEPRGSLSQHFI